MAGTRSTSSQARARQLEPPVMEARSAEPIEWEVERISVDGPEFARGGQRRPARAPRPAPGLILRVPKIAPLQVRVRRLAVDSPAHPGSGQDHGSWMV